MSKNQQFLYDMKDHKKISIENYLTLKEHISNLDLNININKYDYCLDSNDVTKKIIYHLEKF